MQSVNPGGWGGVEGENEGNRDLQKVGGALRVVRSTEHFIIPS